MSSKEWARMCCAFVSICCPVIAQTQPERIEIASVPIRPGISVSEALLLLKGTLVSRDDKHLLIQVQKSGGRVEILGTLYLEKEIVIGACRYWEYSEFTDAELARVLFAAVSGAAKESSQKAVVVTSIEQKPEYQQTNQILRISIGQRTIDVVRMEGHRAVPSAPLTSVEECLWKP